VVIGGDIVSAFVVSGFQSFKSLSPGICKPFDAGRDGLNLGEGAGTLILSTARHSDQITMVGGASANDANHISGPSRTGEGLFLAVTKALAQSNVLPSGIDFISAHGTATPFNDEMESKAFSRCGLGNVPLNSFKAYIGHALGGAGVIESAFAIHGMKQSLIYPTLGYKEFGVPEKITVTDTLTAKVQNTILKTASGFGGSNAAIVFKK
jgi:3-oxoacyl-[acyl-carrier-protein] synthase-1